MVVFVGKVFVTAFPNFTEFSKEMSSLSIVRMKLACRNLENLLLTDEVFTTLNITWDQLKKRIETWLDANTQHPHLAVMEGFKDNGYDRKNHDIKEMRNDLMGIIGSAKPWEVVVGQVIAGLSWIDATSFEEEGKMLSYLGKKVVENLIPKQNS